MSRQSLVLSRAAVFLLSTGFLAGTAFAQIPSPQISNISPSAIAAGASDTQITITGANFGAGSGIVSSISFNGFTLAADAVTAGQIKVTVPAAALTSPLYAPVAVTNLLAAAANAKPTLLATTLAVSSARSNTAYVDVAAPAAASFSQIVSGTLVPGTSPTAFAFGNIYGNSLTDVAVGNADGSVQLFKSDGKGGYTLTNTLLPPTVSQPLATNSAVATRVSNVVVGDFNNDGLTDVAVVDPQGVVTYLQQAAGGFTTVTTVTTLASGAVNDMKVADFNGDGTLDIAILQANQTFTVLQGDGTGNFTAGTPVAVTGIATDGSSNPKAMQLADVNGDGTVDAVIANQGDSSVSVLLNTITSGVATFAAQPALAAGNGPGALTVADFNNDGTLDIVLANFTNGTYTFLFGNGDGTFSLPLTAQAKTATAVKANAAQVSLLAGTLFIVNADFNADGEQDIAITDGTNVVVYSGDGSGNFQYASGLSPFTGLSLPFLAVADVNSDGYPDLIGGFSNGTNAGFAAVVTVPVMASASPFTTSASSLAFGNVNLGASATQTLVLTNNGTSDATGVTVTIGGTNASDFTSTTNCATVTAGSTCTLTITFAPTATSGGAESATLTITDAAGDKVPVVALAGTGVGAPNVGVASTLSVGNAAIGASVSKSITITNSGSGPLSITAVTATAPFSVSSNGCSAAVAPGATCSVTVALVPTAVGSATGTLTLTDNAGNVAGSTQTVALSGVGQGAVAAVSPAALAFGNQNDGTTSAAKTVTITNNGNVALTVSAVSTAAPFAATGCTGSVAAGASCTISVTFAPTATGAATGTLTITDTSAVGGTTQTVSLTGTGVAVAAGPKATVTPASLTFSSEVNNTTAAQTVTLKNTGTSALSITSIASTGQFLIAGRSCGTILAVNASCAVAVVFRPTAATTSPATGTLTFTDNSVLGKTQVVTLSGTVLIATAKVSPAALSFGSANINSTTAAQVITLTNTGTGALTINYINLTGNFVATASTCNRSVAAGASCTVSVAFLPRSAGALTGTLTFGDNSSTGSTQSVSLTGTAVNRRLTANPGVLSFNSRTGTKSNAQTITISNPGSVIANLTGVTVSGANAADFAIASNTCGSTLAVGATCKVSLTFTSATRGFFSAQLNVASDAPAVSVPLFGVAY